MEARPFRAESIQNAQHQKIVAGLRGDEAGDCAWGTLCTLLDRNSRDGFFEDLSGDLHRADLATGSAALFREKGKLLHCRVAYRHLGMAHPTGVGRPAWTAALPRYKARL